MKDKEIIKALEKVLDKEQTILLSFFGEGGRAKVITAQDILDLINRRGADIERLENELKITREYIHDNNLELDLLIKIKHNSLCETETYESR